MYEAEHLGVRAVLNDRLQAALVVVHVALQFSRFNVEHVDEHLDVPEDALSLRLKVVLHERLLTAAVPQIEHQIAEKPNVTVLHIDGSAQSPGVSSDVVGEDDRSHAGLARTRLAHKQYLGGKGCAINGMNRNS